MSSAMDAVLSTGELLEAILLQLDMRTLLVCAPLVCQHWRSSISDSPALQSALFFSPAPRHGADTGGRIPPKTQNPLLKDLFPAWFENTRAFTPRPRPGVNPVHIFPATAMMGYKRFQELPLYRTSLRLDLDRDPRSVDASRDGNPFLRRGASWRRMLTSQPPCRDVAFSDKRGPGASMARSPKPPQFRRCERGLRMGELYDMVLRHAIEHPVSGFMVVWPGYHGGGGGGEGDDDDADGFMALARHLKRMSGILPVISEVNLRLVWERRPDVLVQMLWTDGRLRPGEVEGKNLERFWKRLGSETLSDGETWS